ncbi:MAG: ABC transporter ATP-binding protein [Bryobacteraceae bacterium]|jgi:ABC-2 type transport system ATP-binding protein
MLEAKALKKAFGSVKAVDGVSLRAARGETVGLLGPNGAGKTTTVSIVAGLLRPDSGEVLIEGRPLGGDTDPLKRQIGLVPQDVALYDELSAMQNLALFGALYGLGGARLKRATAEALDLAGLADRAKDKVAIFSGGMKRRLNIVAAMLHDPAIILLDEPTVGVDPQSRNAIFENLEIFKKRGKTLIYTTHYMEEAERVCDRLIIIDHGKVVADDTLRGLYRLVPATNLLNVELDRDIDGAALEDLRHLPEVKSAKMGGGVLKVGVPDLSAGAPRILAWLAEGGHSFHHISSERADLETVFLTLTGRKLRD